MSETSTSEQIREGIRDRFEAAYGSDDWSAAASDMGWENRNGGWIDQGGAWRSENEDGIDIEIMSSYLEDVDDE